MVLNEGMEIKVLCELVLICSCMCIHVSGEWRMVGRCHRHIHHRSGLSVSHEWWYKQLAKSIFLMMDIDGANMARRWLKAIPIPGMTTNLHECFRTAFSLCILLFVIELCLRASYFNVSVILKMLHICLRKFPKYHSG